MFNPIVIDWRPDRTPDPVSQSKKFSRTPERRALATRDRRKGTNSKYNHNSSLEKKNIPRGDSGDRLPLFPALESGDFFSPPYPLQIEAIPIGERVRPDLLCRVVHRSGYRVPGSFTYAQALEILEITRLWDWTIDERRRPACRSRLLPLLERIAGKDGDRSLEFAGGGDNA